MLPCNLEIVLFLKMNFHRWNAMSVQKVMTKFEKGHYKYADNVLGYHGHVDIGQAEEVAEEELVGDDADVMELDADSQSGNEEVFDV